MSLDRPEMFRLLAVTPKIDKVLGHAVALCPTAPLVAESGKMAEKSVLRITNYQSGEVLSHVELTGCHTLAFSPDGKRLLALPGGRGSWNDAVVLGEPWGSAPVVYDESLHQLFHGAWLESDEQKILLAGTARSGVLCIALLDVSSGKVQILYEEGPFPGSITITS